MAVPNNAELPPASDVLRDLFSARGLLVLLALASALLIGHVAGQLAGGAVLRNVAPGGKPALLPAAAPPGVASGRGVHLMSVVLSTLAYYAVLVGVLLATLSVAGIPISGVVASLGVLGVALGVLLQKPLQDMVAGFLLAWGNAFDIGDVIEMDGRLYNVEDFGLLTTRLRDAVTRTVTKMANAKVHDATVSNVTRGGVYYVAYDFTVSHANRSFEAVALQLVTAMSTMPYVRATGRRAEVGLVAVNDYGTRLRINIPLPADRYTTELALASGINLRDLISAQGVALVSPPVRVTPPPPP
jgi:small-conductance mechanosensitive channel